MIGRWVHTRKTQEYILRAYTLTVQGLEVWLRSGIIKAYWELFYLVLGPDLMFVVFWLIGLGGLLFFLFFSLWHIFLANFGFNLSIRPSLFLLLSIRTNSTRIKHTTFVMILNYFLLHILFTLGYQLL